MGRAHGLRGKVDRYDLKEAAPRSPEAFAIHPFGKIPVLRHGDFELCELKAIATYLDLSFPGPKLIPTEPRDAALTEQWVSLVNTRIDTTMIRTYLFAYIFPKTADGKPDRKAIDALAPTVEQEIGLLDRAVAKAGFLAGDSLTYADLNLMPILFSDPTFPGRRRGHRSGEAACRLLSAPGRTTEFSEYDAAARAAAAAAIAPANRSERALMAASSASH